MAKKANRVVNRSSGILGIPDPEGIWNDIIGYLSEIHFFKGIRILNICAGHGTEARAIGKHLRSLGWSKEEIQASVQLVDNSLMCTKELERLGFTKVFTADLLTWTPEDQMPFDIVIGNPPYSQELWVKFVQKSHELLKEGGYMALVTPTNWVYEYHKSHELVTAYEPVVLHNDVRDKYFPDIAESIGYFIIRKTPIKKPVTVMIGKDGRKHVYDTRKYMVPRGLTSVVHGIITKSLHQSTMHEPFKSANRNFGPDQTAERKYPSLNHTWGMNYTSREVERPGQPKVILSRLLRRNKAQRTMVSFVDYEGALQINDGFYFYVADRQAADSLQWLISDSKLMRLISGYSDKSQYLSPALRVTIPMVPSLIRSDASLYEHFDFSQEEINYIEATVK